MESEVSPVSVSTNVRKVAYYPLDRTLVYHRVLAARSIEIQLPSCY